MKRTKTRQHFALCLDNRVYLYPRDYFKALRLSPSLVRLFRLGARGKSRRPATIRLA